MDVKPLNKTAWIDSNRRCEARDCEKADRDALKGNRRYNEWLKQSDGATQSMIDQEERGDCGVAWGGLRVYCRRITDARSDTDAQVLPLLPSSCCRAEILISAPVISKQTEVRGWTWTCGC